MLGDQKFPMRSMNISETGMLLRSAHDVEVGQEISLEFQIAEVSAFLIVRALVVRKEATDLVGIEFIDLAPENQNAIQLYVMGHLKERRPPQDLSGIKMRRLFSP